MDSPSVERTESMAVREGARFGNGDFNLDAFLDREPVATCWRLANGQKGGSLA